MRSLPSAGERSGCGDIICAAVRHSRGPALSISMAAAGVPVRMMRYTGSFHAFLDRLGYIPQSEDACIEMAKELLAL